MFVVLARVFVVVCSFLAIFLFFPIFIVFCCMLCDCFTIGDCGKADPQWVDDVTVPTSFDLGIARCREFNNLRYYEKNVTVRPPTRAIAHK